MDSSSVRPDDTWDRSRGFFSCMLQKTTMVFTDRYQERAGQVEPNTKHELPGLLVSGDNIMN